MHFLKYWLLFFLHYRSVKVCGADKKWGMRNAEENEGPIDIKWTSQCNWTVIRLWRHGRKWVSTITWDQSNIYINPKWMNSAASAADAATDQVVNENQSFQELVFIYFWKWNGLYQMTAAILSDSSSCRLTAKQAVRRSLRVNHQRLLYKLALNM